MSLKDNFNQALKEILKNDGIVGDDLSKASKKKSELDKFIDPPQPEAEADFASADNSVPESIPEPEPVPQSSPYVQSAQNVSQFGSRPAQQPEQSASMGGGSQPFGGNPNMSGFGGNPNVSGFGGNPNVSGFGGNPNAGGFGGNSNAGGFGGNPNVSGFGGNPNMSGFGGNPNAGGFGGNPNTSGFGGAPNMGYGSPNMGYGGSPNMGGGFGGGTVPPTPPMYAGSNDPDSPYYETEETTVISRNTIITGNIRSFANLNIDGSVKGDVRITKNISIAGKVVGDVECNDSTMTGASMQGNIASKGRVQMDRDTIILGDITSQYLDLNGKIKGNVDVGGKAEFKTDAVVMGNITASTITVLDGATIQGYVNTTFLQESSQSIFPEAIAVSEA